MLGALSPIKLATPDDMGDIGTGTSMVPVDTDSQGNDMAPESVGPFDSMMLIFEEIRDGINQLVELAYTGPKESAGDLRDEGVAEADVVAPEDGTDSQGNDSGGGVFGFLKGLEIPKPGPKLGLALLLGGMAALFKFGDKLVPIIAPVLKFIKEDVLPVAIDLATKAFDGIKTVFTYLYDNVWPFIRDNVITNAVDFVKDAFDGLSNLFTGIYDKILVIFGGKNADGSDATILDKLTALGGIFGDLGMFIVNIGNSLITNVLEMFGVNFEPYDSAGAWVLGKLNEMWQGISGFFGDAKDFVVEGFTGAYDFVSKKVMAAFEGVTTWFSETGTFLLEGATGIVDFIKEKLKVPFAFLTDLFSFPENPTEFATKLIDIILLPYNLAINFLRGIFGFGEDEQGNVEPFSLGEFIVGVVKDAIQFVKDIFTFDTSALKERFGSMVQIFKGLAAGGAAAASAMLPGGESPGEAFNRVFSEYVDTDTAKSAFGIKTPEETFAGAAEQLSPLEEIKRNQMAMDIYDDADPDKVLKDGNTVESKLLELEMRNQELMSQLTGAQLTKLAEFEQRQGFAEGGGIALTSTDASTNVSNQNNTIQGGDFSVTGTDGSAKALSKMGYGDADF